MATFYVTVDRYTGQIELPDDFDDVLPESCSFHIDMGDVAYGSHNGVGSIYVDTGVFVSAYSFGRPIESVSLEITYIGDGRFDVSEAPESDTTSVSEKSNSDPDSDSTDDEYGIHKRAQQQADDATDSDDGESSHHESDDGESSHHESDESDSSHRESDDGESSDRESGDSDDAMSDDDI